MKILLIEDDKYKCEDVKSNIENSFSDILVDTVKSYKQGVMNSLYGSYDLLLIDMTLPTYDSESVSVQGDSLKNGGEMIVNEVYDEGKIVKIAIVTQYETFDGETLEVVERRLKRLCGDNYLGCVKYCSYKEDCDDTWKTPLKNKIMFLIKYKKKMAKEKRKYKYDVAIINALQEPENTQVQKVFGDNWKLVEIEDDKTNTYYETIIKDAKGHDVSIVTAFMSQMAGVSSATLTTKVIYNFAPRYIFMTGIAAGIDQDDEGYGDILICSEVWDGASGKIKTDKNGVRKFEPDYRPLAIDAELKNICMRMKADKDLLNNIENKYPTKNGKPKTHLQVQIGPMASVPAVTARKEEIDAIKEHQRKLIGIEMESYGMFYAVSNGISPRPKYCASFKSVSDFADVSKADDYQEYASYTSAAFLKELICNKLDFDF